MICDRAGLKGNFTNHSGKRTCAIQLYIAGVAEQEIMARTGHRSEKSVRKYSIVLKFMIKLLEFLIHHSPAFPVVVFQIIPESDAMRTVKLLFEVKFQNFQSWTILVTGMLMKKLKLCVRGHIKWALLTYRILLIAASHLITNNRIYIF